MIEQDKSKPRIPSVSGEVIEPELRRVEMSKTASLPEELLDTNIISCLEIGESAYVVPWAMAVTERGECFLNGEYSLYDEAGGTANMLLKRTKEGFEVEVPQGYKYRPSKINPWVGGTNEGLLPVSKISIGNRRYE